MNSLPLYFEDGSSGFLRNVGKNQTTKRHTQKDGNIQELLEG
jgi:hypothetical protein